MDSEMIMLDLNESMDKAIESLEKRFATVRASRANPSSLDGIMVEYYGSMTPLKQLATISVPEARQLLIKKFDKSCLKGIEKAILASNIGYNPGKNIGIILNKLLEEVISERLSNNKEELIKYVNENFKK